ncbi:MAG: trypsin-like peptidase domain-containing protein, partial [Thermomicrobiales bacterium]
MHLVRRFLVAALLLPAALASPALAQEDAAFGQTLVEGPMTAWCDPGQTLLSGGYDLRGAAPAPPPEATAEEEAPAAPPVVFVSSSRPTIRYDGEGNVAQFGWTAVPNTLVGNAGPLTAYALCAGEPAVAPPAEAIPAPPRALPESKAAAAVAGMTPIEVVERLSPAVVTVINEQVEEGSTEAVPTGSGSGFFLDEEGHVVTNEHVVSGGVEFVVVLFDGTELPATLVGA